MRVSKFALQMAQANLHFWALFAAPKTAELLRRQARLLRAVARP